MAREWAMYGFAGAHEGRIRSGPHHGCGGRGGGSQARSRGRRGWWTGAQAGEVTLAGLPGAPLGVQAGREAGRDTCMSALCTSWV